MKVLKSIRLDINKQIYDNIIAKQGDSARYLLFRLLDNGVPFSLEGKTLKVYGVKPDGKLIFNNITIVDIKRGLVELQLTTQMLAVGGTLKLELTIYEGEEIFSTIPFEVEIVRSIRNEKAIESTNEFSALTRGLLKLDEWDKLFEKTSGKIEEKYTERLNNVSSQLSENENKLNSNIDKTIILENNKMDKNTTDISIFQINKNLGKFDETYLTEKLLQQIAGDAPISSVPANKSITKMKLAHKAVTENETSFLEVDRVNMFDRFAVTDKGKIIRDTDGILIDNEIGCISEYIEVNPGQTVRCTLNWTGAFYNNNLEFIAGKGFGITEFIVPEDAKFYRQSISISKLDSLILTIDKDLPTKYIDYYDYNLTMNKALKDAVRKVVTDAQIEVKRWGAVGDSLTEKNVTAKENYTDFISKDFGLNCVNFGLGGSGYMRKYDTNEAFYQRVNNLPLDLDVITIFGSGNDLALYSQLGDIDDAGTDTICGCVNKTIDNLLSRFPTTPIGIIAPTPWRGNTPNIINSKMENYVLKLEKICKKRGIPFLDLYHHSNLHPDNDVCLNLTFYNKSAVDGNGDGVHPNDLGHKIITSRIREFIKSLL